MKRRVRASADTFLNGATSKEGPGFDFLTRRGRSCWASTPDAEPGPWAPTRGTLRKWGWGRCGRWRPAERDSQPRPACPAALPARRQQGAVGQTGQDFRSRVVGGAGRPSEGRAGRLLFHGGALLGLRLVVEGHLGLHARVNGDACGGARSAAVRTVTRCPPRRVRPARLREERHFAQNKSRFKFSRKASCSKESQRFQTEEMLFFSCKERDLHFFFEVRL